MALAKDLVTARCQRSTRGARQAGAGLAIGGGGEVGAAEAAQLGDGDIAVEDLLEEEVGGDDRPQVAVAPAVADLLGRAPDEGFGEGVGEAALDPGDGLGDTKHSDLLW